MKEININQIPLNGRVCWSHRGDRLWGEILKINRKTFRVSCSKYHDNEVWIVDKSLITSYIKFPDESKFGEEYKVIQ